MMNFSPHAKNELRIVPPTRFLADPATAQQLVARFAAEPTQPGLSYATVRDYCESSDVIPQITGRDGDLKNVQRPWAIKAVLGCLPPPARILEIGGGEPVVSGFLAELGYDATLVDPYDGFGNGPTEYERYMERFPHVRIVRDYFRGAIPSLANGGYDVIFSVSVLEHIPQEPLRVCFDGIAQHLKRGGKSVHCFDFVLAGAGDEYAAENARQILTEQALLSGSNDGANAVLAETIGHLSADVETFYLSPQGHHNWRGGVPYDRFPFRKVVSLQTVATKQ